MSDETGESGESVDIERESPEDVFGLLSNELRVEILKTLGESPDTGLSFSDLYEEVTVSDSGNFNYHLDKLCGTFVRKEDTYELTYAGKQILGAIYAGSYTATADVDSLETGWTCLLCGGDMVAEYEDEIATLHCVDCEDGAHISFPPGNLDQFRRGELPAAFSRWWHHTVKRITDGFCLVCDGRLDGELVRPPSGDGDDSLPSMAAFDCERCGSQVRVSGATLASVHPIVEGFFAEQGFDTSNRHHSQIWGRLDRSDVSVLAEDPLQLEVTYANDGEAVTVEVGPDAAVRDAQRATIEDDR